MPSILIQTQKRPLMFLNQSILLFSNKEKKNSRLPSKAVNTIRKQLEISSILASCTMREERTNIVCND